MNFQVIVADPPWKLSDRLTMSDVKRGAEANYPVMTVDEICNLPVKDISNSDGCVLCLWVLGSMLEDGMKVMKSWGFEQKQVFVWVKTKKQKSLTDLAFKDTFLAIKKWKSNPLELVNELIKSTFIVGDWILSFGMGRLFRQSHEICLIGINNTKIYKYLENKSQRSVCFGENKGHSTKPENLQDSIDLMFPNVNKLEMFARRARDGWTNIGHNVSNGEDITQSIINVKNKNNE